MILCCRVYFKRIFIDIRTNLSDKTKTSGAYSRFSAPVVLDTSSFSTLTHDTSPICSPSCYQSSTASVRNNR